MLLQHVLLQLPLLEVLPLQGLEEATNRSASHTEPGSRRPTVYCGIAQLLKVHWLWCTGAVAVRKIPGLLK